MTTKTGRKERQLFNIAEAQHGYFTAKQAAAVGYLPTNYTYHVKTGSWIHEGVGIYRLRNFPNSRESQMAFYTLWSRNRNDEVQGVYSHETALSIHDLSDVNPAKLHMTVPSSFRKSAKIPKILKLYYEDLEPTEIQYWHGLKVTSPMRTLSDVFTSGVSHEFIEQAVIQAFNRGLVTKADIKSPKVSVGVAKQILKWIEHHAKRSNSRRSLGA